MGEGDGVGGGGGMGRRGRTEGGCGGGGGGCCSGGGTAAELSAPASPSVGRPELRRWHQRGRG